MVVFTVADLSQLLASLQLLPRHQQEDLPRLAAKHHDPIAFARELVELGWLTPYQASEMLGGRGAQLVLGPFHILAPLGQGGMGKVYKAKQVRLGRVVALKLIRSERLTQPDAVRRFYREVEAAAMLSHPNVVMAFDAGEVESVHYFAMEYVDGPDLGRLLSQKGPLPIRDVCDYARQTALALQHAHERGMVHRDIKPSNLLLQPRDGTIKVLDLGLARFSAALFTDEHRSALTEEGLVIGTPDYIAPEQAVCSSTVDIRADLYSLGCTMYHLLTGELPFGSGTAVEKLLRHQRAEPPPLESLRSETPPPVAALVRRLMAKRPEERCQHPRELAQLLEPFTVNAALQNLPFPSDTGSLPETAHTAPPLSLGMHTETAGSGSGKPARLAMTQTPFGTPSPELDPLPQGALARLGSFRLRHRDTVSAVAFAPDGVWLASAGKDSAVRLWNTATGQQVVELLGHEGWIRAIAFSPNGQLLASAGEDSVVRIWRLADRRELFTLQGHEGCVLDLAFDHHGGVLASAGEDHTARLWSCATGKPLLRLEGHQARVQSVCFLHRGKYLATGSGDRTIRVWNAENGKERRRFEGHRGWVLRVAATPDGKRLISGGSDGTIRLWDVKQGVEVWHVRTRKGWVFDVAASPDGRFVASAHEHLTIRLRDAQTGKEIRSFTGHQGRVESLSFAPDSQTLASGGSDETVRFWSVQEGREMYPRSGHEGPVTAVCFAPDGRMLASGGRDASVCLWQSRAGVARARLRGHEGRIHAVAFAPDGKTVASAGSDETICLWDAQSGMGLNRLVGHTDTADALAFSFDGKRLASASNDGTIRLWDIQSGKEIARLAHRLRVLSLWFVPEGKPLALAVAPRSNVLLLWDAQTGQELASFSGTAGKLQAAAWSSDSRLAAAGGSDRMVRLWVQGTAGPLAEWAGHEKEVTALAFARRGALLASAGADATVRLWRQGVSTPLQLLLGHRGPVRCLAFTSDGTALASGSDDATLLLWDMRKVNAPVPAFG